MRRDFPASRLFFPRRKEKKGRARRKNCNGSFPDEKKSTEVTSFLREKRSLLAVLEHNRKRPKLSSIKPSF